MGRKKIIWSEENINKLGKMHDQKLANEMGISIGAICSKRKSLNIEPFHKNLKPFTQDVIKMLGAKPDSVIAKITGKSIGSIIQARIRRGVPVFNKKKLQHYAWDDAKNIDQHMFFNKISEIYKLQTNEKLTYQQLSKICYWSVSRLQKWFTPGSAQEPLSLPIRHHIWITIISCL